MKTKEEIQEDMQEFSRKKELLIMGLFGLGILCLIALVYVGYEIFSMKEAIAAQAYSIIEVQP